MTVFTIGHSTRGAEEFVALLQDSGVDCVVDVRRFPFSRRYPHFNGESLAATLAAAGIGYRHEPALGGRRGRRRDGAPSPHTLWREEAFANYADYAETPEFRGRDGSRTPLPWRGDADHAGFTTGEPWLPVPPDHRAAGVAVQETNARSALNAWRGLAAWRKAHPALHHGDLTLLDLPAPLLGFTRACAEESLVLVFNPSAHAARVSLADYPGIAALEDAGFAVLVDGDVVLLPPYGVFIGALGAAAATRPQAARAVAV